MGLSMQVRYKRGPALGVGLEEVHVPAIDVQKVVVVAD